MTRDLARTTDFLDFLVALQVADPLVEHVLVAAGAFRKQAERGLLKCRRQGLVEIWQAAGYPPALFLTPLGAIRAKAKLSVCSTFWLRRPDWWKLRRQKLSRSDFEGIADDSTDFPDVRTTRPGDLVRAPLRAEHLTDGRVVPKIRKFRNQGRPWLAPEVLAVRGLDLGQRRPCPVCGGAPLEFDEACLLCLRTGVDDLLPGVAPHQSRRVYAPGGDLTLGVEGTC